MTYFFETYGCQMNSAESAALGLTCEERGWVKTEDKEKADLVLINTCSVRITAEKRAFGRVALYSSLKKKRVFTLVIAGCLAQRLGGKLMEKFPGVDYVMGTSSRSFFPLILEATEKGVKANLDLNEKPVFSFSDCHFEQGQFRSFVPITHGCNNFCSYCVVPYVRGTEVCRDPEDIEREIRLVGEKGAREITLLGQNVNSYFWRDSATKDETDFSRLLERAAHIAQKSGIKWIRFLSANPKNFSSRTIQVMAANPVFCRHLHLPVQHGSNNILKAMNRGYTVERFLELVREIRAAMPGITLSTDILMGFPGEIEEDVEKTLQMMDGVKFLYAYMYHFNPREGTKAFDLPNMISDNVKKERLSRVIALQKKHTSRLLRDRIGSVETVLVEGISRKNADELITRTERDEMAVAPGDKSMIGSFATLTLSALKGNTFLAKEALPCPGVL